MKFLLNHELKKYVDAVGRPTTLTISGCVFGLGDSTTGYNGMKFAADGILYYRTENNTWTTVYNEKSFSESFSTNVTDSSLYNIFIYGYYDGVKFWDEEHSYVITPASNKLYIDINGAGVFKWDESYKNQFDNIEDTYCVFAFDGFVFVINKGENDLTDKNIVKYLLRSFTDVEKVGTYCIDYKPEDRLTPDENYKMTLISTLSYSHWNSQSYRTISFQDGLGSLDETAISWLNTNGNVEGDILVTDVVSLNNVAEAIRQQVGTDEAGTKYIYPGNLDDERNTGTFIGKIKQLNNTYIRSNPAQPENVLIGKEYWLDGEIREGTMPNNAGNNVVIDKVVMGDGSRVSGVRIPKGYYDGTSLAKIKDTERNKIVSDNIKNGTTILGVEGKYSVIETNPNDDAQFDTSEYTPISGNMVLENCAGYMDGAIVQGTIHNFGGGAERPVMGNATSSTSSEKIYTKLFLNGAGEYTDGYFDTTSNITIPYNIFSDGSSYPNNKVAKINDVDYTLSSVASKISEDTMILGVQGTMPTESDIVNTNDAWFMLDESEEPQQNVVVFDIPEAKFYKQSSGLKLSYEDFVDCYNSSNHNDIITENSRIKPENLRRGCSILGVGNPEYGEEGSLPIIDVGATTATASTVLIGRGFYDKNGVWTNGTMAGAFTVKVDRDEDLPVGRFAVIIGDRNITSDESLQVPVGTEIKLRIYSLGTTPARFFIKYGDNDIKAQGSNDTGTIEYVFNGSESYEIECFAETSQITGLKDYFIRYKSTDTIVDVINTTTEPNEVLVGNYFWNKYGQFVQGTMPNNGNADAVISTKSQIVSIPAGYTSGGEVLISQSEQDKIIPENIVADTTILGIEGEFVKKIQVYVDGNSSDLPSAFCAVRYGGNSYHYGDTFNATLYKSQGLSITMYIACVGDGCRGYNIFQNGQLIYSGTFDYRGTPIVVERDISITEESLVSVSLAVGGIAVINVSKYAYRLSTVGASDVLSGKATYDKNGNVVNGTLSLESNKSITNNGVYDAVSDGVAGFKKVTVNVPVWGNVCRLLNDGSDNQYVITEGQRYYTEGDEFAIGDSGVEFYLENTTSANPFYVYFFHEDDLEPYQSETVTDTLYNWQPTGDFEVDFGAHSFKIRVYNVGGVDVSDTTATANKVLDGYIFHTADGTAATGTIEINNPSTASNVTIRTNTTDYTHSVASGYYANPTNVSVATSTKTVGANETSQTITGNNNTFLTSVTIEPIQSVYGGLPDASYIATSSDVVSGKWFLGSNGLITEGTYTPSAGGYSCLITSSNQTSANPYVCVSGNGFTDYYSQTNNHFVASTLSCKASYGPSQPTQTNHVYFNNVEQTLDANNECQIQLVTDVNITITGTGGSGATITITNV